MNRRDLLTNAAALPLLTVMRPAAVTAAPGPKPARASFRRVHPSDPGWPSAASWDRLNQAVGGHLIKVEPLLAGCADGIGSAACQDLLKSLKNPYYVGDQPAGTQTAGWVDAWMSAPSVVRGGGPDHRRCGCRGELCPREPVAAGGEGRRHSYQGTSDAADSLLIWTRALNRIELHDAFVPQGCDGKQAAQPAVTVAAGAVWMHIYDAVTTQAGRYVQGGGCATVGVAGLVQSGGFGSFSKNYGTAAGGLLEAEMVTADGRVRIANACTNPDLFWGIKGGGGGSLGVITRLTLRTRELPAFFGGVSLTVQARSDAAFRRLIGRFVAFCGERLIDPHWGESITFGADNTFSVGMVHQGLNQQQVQDIWQPFVVWVAASPDDFAITSPLRVSVMPARDWWNAAYIKEHFPARGFFDPRPEVPATNMWFGEQNTELGVFIHGYQSMWLPASLLQEEQQARLADALFAASRHFAVMVHFNKGLAGADAADVAAAKDTAMNPAVLTAFGLAIIAAGDPAAYVDLLKGPPDLAKARQDAAAIGKAGDALRRVVPNAGSYVSESNFFERGWQNSFWGGNYQRLRAVKAKYDPEGLFFVHHGVGTEGWSADGFTRLA